jgi:subtilase family serine protease
MNDTDLATFFNKYVPSASAADAKVDSFVGTRKFGEGIEAQLDIQYIMGVAPGIKTDFYEQMNSDFCADLKNWTGVLLADPNPPLVHSVSYGWQGNLTQIGCKDAEVSVIDLDYQKLAAAGITIIFASGDSGSGYAAPRPPMPPPCSQTAPGTVGTAYTGTVLQNMTIGIPPTDPKVGATICCEIAGEVGRADYAGWTFHLVGTCEKPNPKGPRKECQGKCTVFKTITGTSQDPTATSAKAKKMPPAPPPKPSALWPSWPASSPWVTAVGATRFHLDVVTNPEAAVSREDHFGSGGGFSPWTALPQPAWQSKAVANFFTTAPPASLPDPTKAIWDKSGRATPDVSALGTAYQVINGGKPLPGGVGGTSASAPAFASMISMLNDALVAKGKKPLGFLNPFLYQNPTAFTDVTIGSNKVGRGGAPLPYGWDCQTGWDPATGLGTPLFDKLMAAAMSAEV